MTERELKHRLAAILSADVVGYSHLMAEDEISTVRTLSAWRDKISAIVDDNEGRVVDFVGDNMLAEFHSALDALDGAIEIQQTLAHLNADFAENRKMNFRIGINLGDVLVDGDVIYGDGVNIAARLEGLSEPGGLCVSEFVYSQVHNKRELEFVDMGHQSLKNIPDPVRVYRVIAQQDETTPSVIAQEAVLPSPKALSLPNKPSLAVLPFVNLSADPKKDYFSDGLTMDIMTALVRIPGLFLISEISMFSYKSQTPSIDELRAHLGVSHVLEGGVRKAGDRVRITARLIETSSGRQIWADRYDRKIDDIFAVQDEITDKIVAAMDIQLVTGEVSRSIRDTIRNPKALETYYRGWEALFRSTKEDIREAQQMFEETIRLEPKASFGYAMAAWAHWWAVAQGLAENVSVTLERAAEMASRAMDLDDFTGLSHLVMAEIDLYHREHDKALAAAEKAVIARPSCDLSFVAKANILTYLGRATEAIDLAKFAIRLAPVSPPFFQVVLATAHYGSGQYEEAIAAATEAIRADQNNLGAFLILAGANAALDRPEASQKAAAEIRRIKPGFSLEKYAVTQPYKDPATLEQVIRTLQKAGLN
ncbi:MAG: adenylate/guanylate cyclase domain-containing protein [Desulfobacterales bacterium]|jgi:adenylate cyclase